ncbi:MAG: O-antigen ligase family protein, partial [Caldilineaceae bacterium]|nr:O-antigen ligase family protein [Caldilineaceae bacterium]
SIWLVLGLLLPITSSITLGPLHLTDLLLLAAVALWFAEGVRYRALRLQPTWLLVPIALYGFILYLALLQATSFVEAATELFKWVLFAVILVILPPMVQRKGATGVRCHWLVIGLVLGGVVQAVIGIYQFIFRIGPEWFVIMGRFMRASGTFNQPNPYAGYLGLTLPIAVSLTFWAFQEFWQQRSSVRTTDISQASLGTAASMPDPALAHRGATPNGLLPVATRTDRTGSIWLHAAILLFYAAATALIGAALIASWSRGGWLGALGSTLVVVLLRSRRTLTLGIAATLLVTLAFLLGFLQPNMIPQPIAARFEDVPAYLGMSDLLNQPLTDENFAIVERLAHWDAALRMWERAPWLGVGPGNYAIIYPEVRLPRWEEALGHAHNIYLNTLAESGIGGFIAYLILWITLFAWLGNAYRRSTQTGNPQERWRASLLIGVIGMLCHLSIHNFF